MLFSHKVITHVHLRLLRSRNCDMDTIISILSGAICRRVVALGIIVNPERLDFTRL